MKKLLGNINFGMACSGMMCFAKNRMLSVWSSKYHTMFGSHRDAKNRLERLHYVHVPIGNTAVGKHGKSKEMLLWTSNASIPQSD